jgi:hypothetical protein
MTDLVTFDFAPTAYEVERHRRRASEGKKQLAIATRRYAMTLRNATTGQQYQSLLHVASIAREYEIEIDVYWHWMKRLHEVSNDV